MEKFNGIGNVEKQTDNKDSKELSFEEAQKEANILRGKLFKEKGKQPNQTDIYSKREKYDWETEKTMSEKRGEKLREDGTVTYEFTTEDYQRISEAINKLKSELEAEPEIAKNLYKFGRLMHNAAKIIGVPVQFLDDTFSMYASHGVSGARRPNSEYMENISKGHGGDMALFIQDISRDVGQKLTDAAKRWKQAEKVGKNYEKTINKQIKEGEKEDNERLVA